MSSDKKTETPEMNAQPESAWKAFDTAPKDGTEVLIRFPLQGNVVLLVNWNVIHKHWESKGKHQEAIEYQGCLWTTIPSWAARASVSPDWPECEDFYNLMQLYRHMPVECPAEVKAAYEEIKSWLRGVASVSLPVPTEPTKIKDCPEGWISCGPCDRHYEYWRNYMNPTTGIPARAASLPVKAEPRKLCTRELPEKRSCNRHSDCDDAEAKLLERTPGMTKANISFNFHCHDEDCEDCFGC